MRPPGAVRAMSRSTGLAEGRAEEGDAGGPAVRGHAGGDGDGGEVEQVRELGEPAELEVAADGVVGDLGTGEGRRHRRDEQRVGAAQSRSHRAAQFLQPVQAAEGVGRAEPASALEYRAGDRQDVVRVGLEERARSASRSATHGPRRGVRLRRGRARGRRDDDGAGGTASVGVRAAGPRADAGVDAEAGDVRHREPRRRPASGRRRRSGPGPGIVRVGAGEDVEDVGGVVDGVREHADAVQRAAGRDDAVGAHQAAGRLEPDDAVHRGGDAARAGGVGAEGEGDAAGGHGDGAARARPARDEIASEDALAGAVGGADAGQPGRELVEVGLADEDRAGVEQPPDGRGVAARRIGEVGTCGRGGEPGGVDVVLHRERDAEERECGRVELFEGACALAQFVGGDLADPDGVVPALGEAPEDEVDALARSRAAAEIGAAQGADARVVMPLATFTLSIVDRLMSERSFSVTACYTLSGGCELGGEERAGAVAGELVRARATHRRRRLEEPAMTAAPSSGDRACASRRMFVAM